jgi:hypothetical protein
LATGVRDAPAGLDHGLGQLAETFLSSGLLALMDTR